MSTKTDPVVRVQQFMIDHGYLPTDPTAHRKLAIYLRNRAMGQASRGLLLSGKTGVGKSFWLQTFCDQRPMYSAFQLERLWQEGRDVFYDQMKFIGGSVVQPHLQEVILDDVGDETGLVDYGTPIEVMKEAIALRYEMFKSLGSKTYISTNLDPEDFLTRYGARIESRMREMFAIITFNGPDNRKSQPQKNEFAETSLQNAV